MSFSEAEIEEFKTEALELLEVAEKSLLELDRGAVFRCTFDAVFRGFHNLKGGAGMMELHELQRHTHELESILMRFKDNDSMPAKYVDLFLRGIDTARMMLEGHVEVFNYSVGDDDSPASAPVAASAGKARAEKSHPQGKAESASLVPNDEFIAEGEEIIERVSKALQEIEAGSSTRETVDGLYRDIHSLKGGSYLFSYQDLGDLAHAMESSLELVRDGGKTPEKELLNALFKCIEVIELELRCMGMGLQNPELKASVTLLSGALLGNPETSPKPLPAKVAMKTAPKPDNIPTDAAKEKDAEGASSIRVSVSLLDNLMTLMGEMVLVRNQVLQFSNSAEDQEFVNLSKRLNVVTSEMQNELMKTRMQPIGNVLTKFNRVVRDLSHDLCKHITISLQGAETEVDKSLLEAIKDPLTHIVRNSCDHGIEAPEVRRGSGKSETGHICIKSYHEGGQVVIEVADDGKGLNRDMLLRKGIEKGIITEAQASQMNEKEIFGIIFAPGFSTAAAITNVSGRGVGMDVVRTNIERIGGTVELSSVAGQGTTIRIKIPLTLAIVPALIVNSEKNIFAIPQVKLVELVRVDSSSEHQIEYLQGSPMYRLRGNILPLVDMNKVLGISKTGPAPAVVNIAVLNAEHCTFGLIVDEVQDTADIVVKPLNRLLKSLQIYSGATVLGDGSIALILDVLGLSKIAQLGKDEAKSAQKGGEQTVALESQDYLLVRVNSPTKHALVLGYVHRLEEFTPADVEMAGGQRVIRYRDHILPLISVNEHLGYGASPEPVAKFPVIVIERAGDLYGIQVEEIIDTLSTSIEATPAMIAKPGIFGSLNTKEELVVVVDPFELVSQAFPERVTAAVKGKRVESVSQKATRQGPPKILLVEDTPFFRKAIGRVLVDAGFDVSTANDGQQAFEMLTREPDAFDIVVSDIEMPRMNGFQLAAAVRAHAKCARLPLLALSSRASKQHIQRGIEAGFNVYLEKLQSQILLKAVGDALAATGRAA